VNLRNPRNGAERRGMRAGLSKARDGISREVALVQERHGGEGVEGYAEAVDGIPLTELVERPWDHHPLHDLLMG
jgi:hypothetical protein